ncbi:DEAD/DEAH box helicase [Stenotrophomonas maltophilia]|uniref:DEAD/DEAH box helicase n=1 Tax=Stenotrophomonas maltophilia TaxID=40324 RepID=UPI00131384E4|nr:ATP-binding domain-containing protein [Stenotrophomonas maltophilia]EKU9980573.1 DEAD/DEAH box helicase [Stenotrophomonas maltophilia]EKX6272055.1 DEAD/DEAH box helicase [Stenotrophomonas maltophilia]MBH1720754.1 DEAD/DEAH box helicase [Stenotrophomonas maltophilia]MBH1793799.1 DEAD/DEAH box helicase [Stenotrophomonas maltophilia]MBH1886018.1 DEAD/DEAH box helicase [Stenotrophomonas maltophilia]
MIEIRRGQVDSPGATEALARAIGLLPAESEGVVYVGYPVMGTPDGPFTIDALLVSPEFGLIAFDLVDGKDLRDFEERHDAAYAILTAKLLQSGRRLSKRKRITIEPQVVTLAPNCKQPDDDLQDYSVLSTSQELARWIENNATALPEFNEVLSTIQSISNIRRARAKRDIKKAGSRGERLQRLEDAIATLDSQQSDAVIQTFDGVQRIRGLAGSGKTVVLALKVAYLYTQNPDWTIAVTFNTKSLKGQFQRFITSFIYDQANEEPDWSRIKVLHAWGSSSNEGIYYSYCIRTGTAYHDLTAAKAKFGQGAEFAGVCQLALESSVADVPLYDIILIDEAQDFHPAFLRLCYRLLKDPKRIVYAYDELQNLNRGEMPPPSELFGLNKNGTPLVAFSDDPDLAKRQDIILRRCYRNSRPVLTTAHALGFGIYRTKGLVQMFDNSDLWEDIGYSVVDGELEDGQNISLTRTDATSPKFLETHSPLSDLISFEVFDDDAQQVEWLADQIRKNIEEDDLRPEDILVIHPNPVNARKAVGGVRSALMSLGINSIIAGVTHSPDEFEYAGSVTFTGIYRAKGNEAAMVYIMNGQFCGTDWDAAWARNILFTGITRSKAWVRVCGFGKGMATLNEEFERVKAADFKLNFTYPTETERKKLNIVNRDLTPAERRRRERSRSDLKRIASDLKAGRIQREDIDEILGSLLQQGE